ncbi:MAG: copper chaperone PCu(A)C [Chloroflexota bacterium]
MRRAAIGSLFGLILLVLLAACGGQTGDTTGDMSDGELVVDTISANLSLPTATGAVYMHITNHTDQDDALIGAAVPGCGVVELHEMSMDGDVMVMRPVEGGKIVVPAGETVVLQPGGLHVMCMDKTVEYAIGDMVPVTLEFETAGTRELTAEVVAPGESSGNMDSMDNMDHSDMDMGGGSE